MIGIVIVIGWNVDWVKKLWFGWDEVWNDVMEANCGCVHDCEWKCICDWNCNYESDCGWLIQLDALVVNWIYGVELVAYWLFGCCLIVWLGNELGCLIVWFSWVTQKLCWDWKLCLYP